MTAIHADIRFVWFMTDLTVKEIAARFGMRPKSIRALASRYGWPAKDANRSASLKLHWQRRREAAAS